MLNNSPWGKVFYSYALPSFTRVPVELPPVVTRNPDGTVTVTRNQSSIRVPQPPEKGSDVTFHIRFLTAKPIRLALMRLISVKQLSIAKALMQLLQESDNQHIVVMLQLSGPPHGGLGSMPTYLTVIQNLSTPELVNNTFLATSSGRRSYLVRYEAPSDGLGARFYFPRALPDGKSLVSPKDKRIEFAVPKIFGDAIKAIFDPRQMAFEGSLEL
jgi:hypothetical protein